MKHKIRIKEVTEQQIDTQPGEKLSPIVVPEFPPEPGCVVRKDEVTLPADSMREFPDPIHEGALRHVFMVPVMEMPEGIPTDPNPRTPRIDRPVWKDIKRHLLNEEGTRNTFHLKNKGITIIAESMERASHDRNGYLVKFQPGQGIVDGGHTYKLLMEAQNEIKAIEESSGVPGPQPVEQHVQVQVLTGVPIAMVPEIARGLNTAIQVQEMSLMELQHNFDWVKEVLRSQPYASQIAYREGDDAPLDARDIITIMELFNIVDFPNDGNSYPIRAYTAKAQVLANYKSHPDHYQPLASILPDIIALFDLIEFGSLEYAEKMGKHEWPFIQERKRGMYQSVFTGAKYKRRLVGGALFPVLGAFRWLVELHDGVAQWKGGFDRVKHLWYRNGVELMRMTQQTSIELGRKPYAIGRSLNHWSGLHKTIAHSDMVDIRRARRAHSDGSEAQPS